MIVNMIMHRACEVLKDPYLVRKFQERCGVKVLFEVKDSDSDCTINNDNNRTKSTVNGAIRSLAESLATQPIRKKQVRRKQPGMKMEALLSSPDSGSPPPEFPDIVVETYPLLDIYFRLASELGYEPFYITILPIFYWNIDTLMFRHFVMLWVLSMYIGQALKSLIKLPRPPAPPAIRLEENLKLEYEYGFPSTHAVVSTTIPFYLAYMVYRRYQSLFYEILLISILWCVSVCFSRLYLGIHCVLDIIGGVCISLVMLTMTLPFLDWLDYFTFHWPYTPPVAILLVIFAIYIYPVNKEMWTADRGDTAAILGVGLGIMLGSYYCSPSLDDLDPGPFPVSLPSLQDVGLGIVRWVVGILIIYPTRFIMKLVCFRLLPAIVPTHGVQEVQKRPLVLLPYKIITYSSIGISATYLCPIIFEMCNISRWPS